MGVMIRDIGMDNVVIQDVLKGSPAEAAGLQVGDIILSMDGQQIKETQDVIHHLRLKDMGAKCQIDISRQGKKMPVDVSFFEIKKR